MRYSSVGLVIGLTLGLLVAPLCVTAQQAGKIPRVGFLSALAPGSGPGGGQAFLQGLQEHGYVVGENIVIEYRYADGKYERFFELAAELARLPVDVIIAPGTQHALAAKRATATIPIITVYVADPIGDGLIDSLARPGGNVTGIAWLFDDLGAKQLELLQEVVPGLSRVAVLWHAGDPGQNTPRVRAVEVAAASARLQVQTLGVRTPEELGEAFASMLRKRAQALLVVGDPFMYRHRVRIAEFAIQHRLPSAFSLRQFAEAGGLMSYAPSMPDAVRRAAAYVAKILNGAKPADLPVERPSKFELVINLNTVKALGLTMPSTLLFQADHVIR